MENTNQAYQKQQELRAAREGDKRKKARETLRKYSTGKNKGRSQEAIKSAKKLVENATPWGLFSLFFQANLISDWMYGAALTAAVLKDVFDLTAATGFLYIIVFILTLLCSIFIALMMVLGSFSGGSGRAQQKMIRSWLVLIGGTTAEMLFGINFLPIETATVLLVYLMMLSDRKAAKEETKKDQLDEGAQESYA